MKLIEIYIKNYRGYANEVHIPINKITAFIGKNDAGKSTILEALDLFFNQNRFNVQDKHIYHVGEDTVIGCIFSDVPEQVVIDDTAITSLQEEYLLNASRCLEIKKVFSSAGKISTFFVANHPTNEGFQNLLLKKNSELKALIAQCNLQDMVNMSVNSEMRKALWRSLGNSLTKSTIEINADSVEEKKLWPRIQNYLPIFRLFKADRQSTDEDDEAQSPMTTAVKAALQEQQKELSIIAETVQKKVEEVARLTLEKLKEIDPDIIPTLGPHFKKAPAWDKAFSFSLTADNQIPVNKRGSGVRRLILFSFFRATAESDLLARQGIIYAVEEPETALHPDAQKKIVESFIELTERGNCQILLTTHVPGLAGFLPKESLRYVYRSDYCSNVDSSISQALLATIADSLGVFPSFSSADEKQCPVKLIVCVEGPHDVEFLKAVSHMLRQAHDDVIDLNACPSVIVIPLGGGNLQNWVNHNYLQKLGIKEYHIYDSDNVNAHEKDCRRVNARNDGSSARQTRKREMENYIHEDIIREYFKIDISVNDTMDVSKEVSHKIREINPEGFSAETVKKKLNKDCAAKMTEDKLKDRDPNGEILGWLREIASIIHQEQK